MPYLIFKGTKKVISDNVSEELEKNPDISDEDKKKYQEFQTKVEVTTFRDFNREGFGELGAIVRKIGRSRLKKLISELGEKKKAGASEEELEKIKQKIGFLEFFDKGKVMGFDIWL